MPTNAIIQVSPQAFGGSAFNQQHLIGMYHKDQRARNNHKTVKGNTLLRLWHRLPPKKEYAAPPGCAG
jgi:hypothetical protein